MTWKFSLKKVLLKLSSAKWWSFCLGLNVLTHTRITIALAYDFSQVITHLNGPFSTIGWACYTVTAPRVWRWRHDNGPLTRYICRLRMRRECCERFPHHRLQRKPLVSDPGMYHSTCVTHVPWCMSGSLTRGGRWNDPGIPGVCATHNFAYLARGPCLP